MNNFIKLTKADGRIMIIDVNNVQCIEQVDGLTLVQTHGYKLLNI